MQVQRVAYAYFNLAPPKSNEVQMLEERAESQMRS